MEDMEREVAGVLLRRLLELRLISQAVYTEASRLLWEKERFRGRPRNAEEEGDRR